MSEWKGNGSAQELRIGDIQAVAGVNGTAIVYASVVRTAPRQLGMDAAKAAAEQALREMHDALSAHLAPVLRWTASEYDFDEAKLLAWVLEANDHMWCVRLTRPVRFEVTVTSELGNGLGRTTNRRAAEAALRALGVVFRVESES